MIWAEVHGMSLAHFFNSDTVLRFPNTLILAENHTEKDAASGPVAVVQTCSLTFQQEWHSVRTALMDLVGEFPGAKQRFVDLFQKLQPTMTAPEWAQCW